MLITELRRSCLLRQVDRMLRAVMQTRVTDFTVIQEAHTVFIDRVLLKPHIRQTFMANISLLTGKLKYLIPFVFSPNDFLMVFH